jgi:hypothetical protein
MLRAAGHACQTCLYPTGNFLHPLQIVDRTAPGRGSLRPPAASRCSARASLRAPSRGGPPLKNPPTLRRPDAFSQYPCVAPRSGTSTSRRPRWIKRAPTRRRVTYAVRLVNASPPARAQRVRSMVNTSLPAAGRHMPFGRQRHRLRRSTHAVAGQRHHPPQGQHLAFGGQPPSSATGSTHSVRGSASSSAASQHLPFGGQRVATSPSSARAVR